MGEPRQIDLGGNTLIVDGLRVGATGPGQSGSELTGTEIAYVDGLTPGTATASKALVLDSSKGIATITSATITTLTSPTVNATNIDLGASGTAGSVDIFPTTASKGKLTLSATASTGDTTTTITNAAQAGAVTYTIPDAGAAASFVLSTGTSTGIAATSTELNVLSGATNANSGTGKAVILGTSGAVTIAGAATFNADPIIGAGKTINLDSAAASLTSNAVTLTKFAGVITSEALTTAAGASQAFVLTLAGVAAGDLAMVTAAGGTNTRKNYTYEAVTTTNTITVTLFNNEPVNAINGTLIFNLWVLKA